jgi:hypothetical protein
MSLLLIKDVTVAVLSHNISMTFLSHNNSMSQLGAAVSRAGGWGHRWQAARDTEAAQRDAAAAAAEEKGVDQACARANCDHV